MERDLLISASLLHDICIRGSRDKQNSNKAEPNHPVLAVLAIAGVVSRLEIQFLEHDWVMTLVGLVDTHMGKWGSAEPTTELQKLFHMVDMIASRDYVKVGL